MYGKPLQVINALAYSIRVFRDTLRLWPIGFWIKFWFTNKPLKKVSVRGYDFWVRSNNFPSKLSDIYVILENIAKNIYLKNCSDFGEDAIIIDVGAHIGAFSILASRKAPRGKVYAFEPLLENYEVLKRNVLLQKSANISIFNLAVAGNNEKRPLYLDHLNNGGHSFIKKTASIILVNCRTLAEILAENQIRRCNFLKMDCEGAEYEILLNTPTETLQKIDQIAIEYHSPEYLGLADRKIIDKLMEYLRLANYYVTIKKEDYRRGYIYARRK